MGNRRPVSGHLRLPSITSISSRTWWSFWSTSLLVLSCSESSLGRPSTPTCSATVHTVPQCSLGSMRVRNSALKVTLFSSFWTIWKGVGEGVQGQPGRFTQGYQHRGIGWKRINDISSLMDGLTFNMRGWPTLTPLRALEVRKLCVKSFMLLNWICKVMLNGSNCYT